ncbi:MAG: S-methyl-5-thioribose-1-phosphate isomerase, partial [Lachnospiraceae bacterium]|nr:S-methyl-5-thioribose-1-phosphate isomerase [Lachnospiraceae bacterium]
MNALSLDTVVLADNKKEMIILDQTLLPNEVLYLHLSEAEKIWEAIKSLRVRGAPAIGVAAGYGIYILASQCKTD